MGLKNLRIKNSYSQEQLADLSSLSTRTIQRIEKENNASCESIKILADVFNLQISEMEACIKNTTINENITHEKSIKAKSFFQHLLNSKKTFRFFIINIFLIILNLSTNYQNLWFIYVLLAWGFFHFYKRYEEYRYLK